MPKAPAVTEVIPRTAPTAMVWKGVGLPHEEVAVPGVSLAPGDVLVRVELATICGSDLHTVQGHRRQAPPVVLGHEQVGRVVAVGEDAVTVGGAPVEAGMRVVWSVCVSCGECDRCRRGLPQKCRSLAKYGHDRMHRGWELSGGFATHVVVRRGTAIAVVDEETPATVLAPASCATATAVAAIETASAHTGLEGETVLVTGAGMLGLTVTALAADRGARVVVSDPDPARREAALRFGASAVADPGTAFGGPTGVGGVLAGIEAAGGGECLAVIEMSGQARAVAQALRAVGVGGVVVLVGSVSPGARVEVDPEQIVRRLVTVRGVHNYDGDHLVSAVGFLQDVWHRRPFAELVSATFPLERIDEAMATALSGDHVRVGLVPDAAGASLSELSALSALSMGGPGHR